MSELYYIRNVGCDDVTCGLAIIPYDIFPLFKLIVSNLNKNSQCGCMPIIEIFRITKSFIRPATDKDEPYDILHTNNGDYVLAKNISLYDSKTKKFSLAEGVEKVC